LRLCAFAGAHTFKLHQYPQAGNVAESAQSTAEKHLQIEISRTGTTI